jgi:hypothetical protein
MTNIEVLIDKLKNNHYEVHVDKTIDGSIWLDIQHVCIKWHPSEPNDYFLDATFDPIYSNQFDMKVCNISVDQMFEKVCGFVDNKLITTVNYKISPEEYRARFGS